MTSLPAPAAEPDHSEQVTDRIGAEGRMRAAPARIEALPDREREVLGLVAWSGLTYEQAAAASMYPSAPSGPDSPGPAPDWTDLTEENLHD